MEGAAAGSNALSAYGAIQGGKMTSDSLNNQATNLDAQAQEALQKGQYDAMREQMIAGHKIGTSVAAYGASGVKANSGSVLDVVQASHANAELDKMNILHGADIRAINFRNQAAMDRFGAQSAIQASYWKALGSITGGAMKYAGENSAAKPGAGSGGEGAALESGGAEEAGMAGADSGAAAAAMA